MKTLIYNCEALLMNEESNILSKAFVVVEGATILSVEARRPEGVFDREIDGEGDILMPGLVNAHTHIPMALLRGHGGGTDLQTWLNDYIFPAEDRLDARAIRAGSRLALAELIAGGVTCIADMYSFCHEICQEVVAAGISGNIARGTVLFTPHFDPATYPAIVELKQLVKDWHGHNNGQILVDASIHGEYTSNSELWQYLADFAAEAGIGMHVHVSETKNEHQQCQERHGGKTPVQILDHYGVWNSRAIIAHGVYTTPDDWAILRKKGVTIVHNPASNLKLGSGIAPIPAICKAGVSVALGTDGVASNNSHDMFEEMKLAAILHNGANCDPLALLPRDVLEMATTNGAKALGRKSGRIAPGYTADLILVSTKTPGMTPCRSVIDNLVYSAHGSDVRMNMARGEIIYRNGTFFTIDLEETYREVHDYGVPLVFGKP